MNTVTLTPATIPNLQPGETGYSLPDGTLIAISVTAGKHAAPDMFSLCATARVCDTEGATKLNHEGQPLVITHHRSTPKLALHEGRVNAQTLRQEAIDNAVNNADGVLAEIAAQNAYSDIGVSSPLPKDRRLQ